MFDNENQGDTDLFKVYIMCSDLLTFIWVVAHKKNPPQELLSGWDDKDFVLW